MIDTDEDDDAAAAREERAALYRERERLRFADALAGARDRGAADETITAALERALAAGRDVADEIRKVGRH